MRAEAERLHPTVNLGDAAIIEATLTMCGSLGMKAVAEWVECEERLSFLGTYRCEEAQGYPFSRPVGAGDMAALMSFWFGSRALSCARACDATRRARGSPSSNGSKGSARLSTPARLDISR